MSGRSWVGGKVEAEEPEQGGRFEGGRGIFWSSNTGFCPLGLSPDLLSQFCGVREGGKVS